MRAERQIDRHTDGNTSHCHQGRSNYPHVASYKLYSNLFSITTAFLLNCSPGSGKQSLFTLLSFFLVITSPPGWLQSFAITLSVCSYVCPLARLNNHMSFQYVRSLQYVRQTNRRICMYVGRNWWCRASDYTFSVVHAAVTP